MIVHLDLFSGASGDKLAGALLDVAEQTGAYSLAQLQDDLAAVEGRIRVRRERVERCGIAAWHVEMVDSETGRAADAPDAAVHDHVHWSQIRALIEAAPIDDRARELAVAVFERIATGNRIDNRNRTDCHQSRYNKARCPFI